MENHMDTPYIRHTNASKFYKSIGFILFVAAIILLSFGFEGCKFWNGTYYFYLSTPPKITTDWNEADEHRYFTKKTLNDSVFYYYAEGKHSVTKNHDEAKYITRIGQFRHGAPVKLVWLDGFGDTMRVECYEKRWKICSDICYYGEKHIESRNEYKDGKLHGISEDFYPNGIPKTITSWEEGVMHGAYFNYYPNGQLRIKGYYTADKFDKTFLYFNEQGDTLKIEYWDKGILLDCIPK
ncbi:MAG: hypothetical protein IJT51_09095 [Bacteroidales bacterium]|nr:hypothetical protein [Bacteroidales bacterium]